MTVNPHEKPLLSTLRGTGRFIRDLWGIVLVLALWEAVVVLNRFNAIVLPRPLDVLREMAANPDVYLGSLAQTGMIAAGGLAIGAAVGTSIAVLAWYSRILEGLLTPLGLIFSSIPVVAMIPVLARLLGYDVRTVLAIVAILSFFPFFVFTSSGLRALPPGSGDLMRVFGARKHVFLLRLSLPAALPNWLVACRLAVPNAILAAMVAEFLMGTNGLGALLHAASQEFQTERALGASVMATLVSVTLFVIVSRAERQVREIWS